MEDTNLYRYDFLNRKTYIVHAEHERFIRSEMLQEISQYETFEFYSQERICDLSAKKLIPSELRKHLEELKHLRQQYPEGSNQECICMDMITELIGKLDLLDFRELKIDRIVDDTN